MHSRDGTSRRPRDAPAPRAPATPAGAPPRAAGADRDAILLRAPVCARAFAAASARTAGVARARHDITVDQRAGGALACGGGVRAAGSALAVRPRPSLLTRQSVRKPRTHLLSCETSSSFKPWRWGWGGAGLALGAGRFFGTAFSVCFRRESSPWFANFGVNPISRSIFAPSHQWETVGHSVGCHPRAPAGQLPKLWGPTSPVEESKGIVRGDPRREQPRRDGMDARNT